MSAKFFAPSGGSYSKHRSRAELRIETTMFKIQDNEDGSTSVYCKNSGNLLCTIPAKRNSNAPRRVNVVEPQPAAVAGPSLESRWHLSENESTKFASNELIQPKEEPIGEPITSFRESKCCISPIPINPDGDQSEDYFDDCITEDAFAKCLNLVSREKLQTRDRKTLLAEYPLRLLSRSKAYRTLKDLRDLKLPDFMPLTSNLGMKILELNVARNFSNAQKVQISVKKYDSYCRFPFNAPKPSSCHFPKLRCREKKMYPIATTAKTLKHDANHFYTYGRRQRRERMKVMATGLNRRSRKLLKLCKNCSVKVKRLTKAEIKSWKKKNPISASGAVFPPSRVEDSSSAPTDSQISLVVPGTRSNWTQPSTSLVEQPEAVTSSTSALRKDSFPAAAASGPSFLKSDSPLPFLLRTPLAPSTSKPPQRSSFLATPSSSSRRPQNKCNREPTLSLRNVIGRIHKSYGHYWVRGTNIRVPFFADFLETQRPASRRPTDDHPYSSLSKQCAKAPKAPLRPCNAELNPSAPCLGPSPPIEEEGKATIPLIDLTLELTPPKDAPRPLAAAKKLVTTQSKFYCFACGFSGFYSLTVADAAIRDHMRSYHSVNEPDCFLTKYLDRVNKCTIVEAFPGYKDATE